MTDHEEEYPRTVEGFLAMRKTPYRSWTQEIEEGDHNGTEC